MIEIICDSDNKEEKAAGADENTKIEKIPRNIRQIGSPQGSKRIYIEDYVVTYLNYIARPGSTMARGAILLGEEKQTEMGEAIFINGAVDAQNIEFDMDETQFSDEIWSDIYEQIKLNFPDSSVVGWFLSRMGFSTAITDKIEKMHVENFPGKDKVLYITDSLDCDDAFYMYEKGGLKKQKGYYIYYAKNENMQNYIIKQRGDKPEEAEEEIKRKDEEIIKKYRAKNRDVLKERNTPINLAYVAGSFAVLVMVAMGITLAGNYQKMKDMEVSLNRLELTATDNSYEEAMMDDKLTAAPAKIEEPSDIASVTDIGSENTTQDTTIDEASNLPGEEATTTQADPVIGEEPTDDEITTEQSLPASTDGNPTYYYVKYGDTLSSIAVEFYGNIQYIYDIAQANDMSVDDKIYEGQQLILPGVKAR